MQWWKWLGVAGMAGVAATGVVVARNERQRRAYAPDDVRARLHERAAAVEGAMPSEPARSPEPSEPPGPSKPPERAPDRSATGNKPRKGLLPRLFRQ